MTSGAHTLLRENPKRLSRTYSAYFSEFPCVKLILKLHLALINPAGGRYGRILKEVVSTDRGQDSPIQTDLARLIRCLLYGKNKNNSIRSM